MSENILRKGAFVVCKAMPNGPHGEVLRVGKNGDWCDVVWVGKVTSEGSWERWVKRMRPEVLQVVGS
jgi:hypothetical protein